MEPRSPERLRALLREIASRPSPAGLPLPGTRGVIISQFDKALTVQAPDGKVDKEATARNRYATWSWLLALDDEPPREYHAADLDGPMWAALEDWVRVDKNPVIGKWLPTANFQAEARWALNRVRRDAALNGSRIAQGLAPLVMAELMTGGEPESVELDEDGYGRALIELGGEVSQAGVLPLPAGQGLPADRGGDGDGEVEPEIAIVPTARLAGAALPDWV